MRAICTVIINTDKLLCIGRKIACTEPYNIISAVAKARNKRIVGVKNKLSFWMNTILYGIVNPFRMTVSCELVTVKVCDNIMSRCDVLPLLPVTATIYFGSSIRPRISGQSLSAICPGRLLPLPSNPPTNFRTLHTIIVNSFFILPLP